MATHSLPIEALDRAALDWLMGGDPSIRWQVMSDLSGAGEEAIRQERARTAFEGWGASLLRRQRPDGQWGDGETHPFWWTNLYSLVWLRDLGVDPKAEPVRKAVNRVREQVTWGEWHGHSPFFEGEVEPCINGRVVALAAYFGERADALVDRLLSEQLEDRGWNCEAEHGSVRSSFHTTICVLEGLLEYERSFGADTQVAEARGAAEDYLLERHLLRRRSTGDVIDLEWTRLTFPPLWHYDILRSLDYFRATGRPRDERLQEAFGHLAGRRMPDGRWLRDIAHRNTLYEEFSSAPGTPNRWITLRAMRVGRWLGEAERSTV